MLTKPILRNIREIPTAGIQLEGMEDKSSLELMDEDAARLPADERYRLYQHRGNSWSHNGDWGRNAVRNVNTFWSMIGRNGLHYEDDVFCDFGGNDGTVAASWQAATGNVSYSVDLDTLKQGWGRNSYKDVRFINSFLESIPLADKSVDWGFCSHTLEHVADLDKALSEIQRIVKQALFVVVPLEHPDSFWKAEPHMRGTNDPLDWLKTLRRPDWHLAEWGKPVGAGAQEMFMLYVTEALPIKHNDLHAYYLDTTCAIPEPECASLP